MEKEMNSEQNPFEMMMAQFSKLVDAKTKPLVDEISELKKEVYILRQPITMPDAKAFYKSEEVCKLLEIHSNTLYRLRASGQIGSFRIGKGKEYRYSIDDVNMYMQSSKFKKPEIALSLTKGHKTSHGGEAQCAPPRTPLGTRKAKRISA